MKNGEIWVSAVLYIALGVVLITIILNAGLPLINKLRDRNTLVQTRTVIVNLDNNIRIVSTEGPGSRRYISPLSIESGELKIDEVNDKILWGMITNAKLIEPGINFTEGDIITYLVPTATEDQYNINLELNVKSFANISLSQDTAIGSPLTGTYSIVIEHTGSYDSRGLPIINIRVV